MSNFSIKKLAFSVKSLFDSHNPLKKSVEELKEQNEDHLNSINENTNELQSNYEYSLEIDSKLNKLAERIDEISMTLGVSKQQEMPEIPKLSTMEKGIFLALYKFCDEYEYTTYKDIAEAVNLSETLIMNYITILLEKGIPIIKSYVGGRTRLKLSSYFKNIQTKKDILRINQDASKQIVLNNFISEK